MIELSKELEKRHFQLDEIETRMADDKVVSFSGYVVKFGKPSVDMGFTEYVDKRAFDNTLKDDDHNIFALYNHDWDKPLASTRNGTLKLWADERGLQFELTPKADTSFMRDVKELVESGELRGCSFGFRVNKDKWETRDGKDYRILLDVDLFEVTLTSNPAYQSSEISTRSYDEYKQQKEQQSEELELLKTELDLLKTIYD